MKIKDNVQAQNKSIIYAPIQKKRELKSKRKKNDN